MRGLRKPRSSLARFILILLTLDAVLLLIALLLVGSQ